MPNDRRSLARYAAPLLALPVLATSLAGCGPSSRVPVSGWHLGWRAETVFPTTTIATTTCRFVSRLSGSGSQIRVELTSGSRFGYALQAGYVSTPTSLTSLDVVPGSAHQLRFGGRTAIRLQPGTTVLSDPLSFSVRPNMGVSVTLTAAAGDAPTKGIATEPGGCASGAPTSAGSQPGRVYNHPAKPRWIRSILVNGPAERSVVAFGDSITEGPPGYYARWSDQLAAAGLPVVNAGVGGGAISVHGLFGSLPGIDRERQVLDEPNVTDLAMLIGTNDLGFGVSGADVLKALDTAIGDAHRRGVKVYVGTILPRTGYGWSATQEAQRAYVNSQLRSSWLTSRGGVLVDSDAVMRDPGRPTRLLPAYDSGDGLHPNAAGSARLGQAFLAVVSPLTPPVTPSIPATTPSTPAPSTQTPTPSTSVEPTPSTSTEPSTSPTPSTGDTGGANAQTPAADGSSLPSLDPANAELAPQTANYLKFRATVPDALSQWNW